MAPSLDQSQAKSYTNSGTRWRVVAFRAVRDGELETIQKLCEEQPVLLHDRFTKEMEDWELEFESLKWFQFRETTCLFIASAYCQAPIVEWLLENGVDEDEKCYMNQVPLDVVGNCHWDDAAAAVIERLLTRPKKAPRAPREPQTSCKLTLEEVSRIEHYEIPSDDPRIPPTQAARRVTESVALVKVQISWATEWLRPTLEYELKYRIVKDYQGRSDEKWTTEMLHCTTKTITGLQPATLYAFEVRARNSAGVGDLAPRHVIETPNADALLAKMKKQEAKAEELKEEREKKKGLHASASAATLAA